MDGTSSAEDDYETLRAIAEGQGIDPEGMSLEELIEALRRADLPGDDAATDPAELVDPGGPAGGGEYSQEGVGQRESPGEPEPE